ncbi:MAG: GTP-binding protein [archaeon]|nr:GTP-binding protein [archaeon]
MTDFKLKVLLLGPIGCGKSKLIRRFVKERYHTDYQMTVGVDILTKYVKIANGIVSLTIWDFENTGRFNFIQSRFLKGGAAAIYVFDLGKPDTFEAIKKWYTKVNRYTFEIPFLLIGNNKESLKDEANKSIEESSFRTEYKNWAVSNGGFYIEVSSQDNIILDEGLIKLTEMIFDKGSNKKPVNVSV